MPPHRYLRMLCICALVSLVVVIAKQIGLSHSYLGTTRTLTRYLGSLQPSGASTTENVTATVSNESAPENGSGVETWRQGYSSNGSFRVVFPRLYAALRPLTGGVPVAVNFSTPTLQSGIKACERPKSQSLVAEIGQPCRTPAGAPADGGLWAPQNCWPPLSRTAVIVPYRNRSENLDVFVPYMRKLLTRQNILFGLFIVEQANSRLFNRAKLLNIGFRVAQQFHAFECFVFQDADKVPENVANVYDCANSPKLLISEMRNQGDPAGKYKPGKLYFGFFGGTVAISREAFLKVNGNSNRYFGWGREDDELSARLGIAGYQVRYNTGPEARFVNLGHSEDIVVNNMPWPYQSKVRQTIATDGLNSLNYTDMGTYLHPMFVLVRADV